MISPCGVVLRHILSQAGRSINPRALWRALGQYKMSSHEILRYRTTVGRPRRRSRIRADLVQSVCSELRTGRLERQTPVEWMGRPDECPFPGCGRGATDAGAGLPAQIKMGVRISGSKGRLW